MAEVELRVYDLTDEYPGSRKIFNIFPGPELKGIWHSSLVVHGHEIDYGQRGVCIVPDGTVQEEPAHKIKLGKTNYNFSTIKQFAQLLARNQFRKENYNVLVNNCHCFSKILVKNILKKDLPVFLTHLPYNVAAACLGKLAALGSHSNPEKEKNALKYSEVSRPISGKLVEKENVTF